MNNGLKPCPFCGSPAKVTKHIWSGHKDLFGLNVSDREKTIPDMFQVVCCGQNENCILSQEHHGWHKTEEGAINSWNTRYKRTCKWWFDCDYDESVGIWTTECGVELSYGDYDRPKFCPNCGGELVELGNEELCSDCQMIDTKR